jgi:hypothetical protein
VIAGIIFFVMAQKTLFSNSPFLQTSIPSGKAPYRTWDCTPSAEFADTLAETLHELLQVTKGQHLTISIQTAQNYESEAVGEHKKGNFVLAIQNYALAINSLMREIKKKGA